MLGQRNRDGAGGRGQAAAVVGGCGARQGEGGIVGRAVRDGQAGKLRRGQRPAAVVIVGAGRQGGVARHAAEGDRQRLVVLAGAERIDQRGADRERNRGVLGAAGGGHRQARGVGMLGQRNRDRAGGRGQAAAVVGGGGDRRGEAGIVGRAGRDGQAGELRRGQRPAAVVIVGAGRQGGVARHATITTAAGR